MKIGKIRTKNLLRYGQCEWPGCKNPAKSNQNCCNIHQDIWDETTSQIEMEKILQAEHLRQIAAKEIHECPVCGHWMGIKIPLEDCSDCYIERERKKDPKAFAEKQKQSLLEFLKEKKTIIASSYRLELF